MKSTLHYRMIGDGHPVVFLHGFLESMTMWDYLQLDLLPCKKILIDLPGHGRSPLIDEDPSIEKMASQVADLLRELKLDAYSVIGHSMGGYVALELNSKIEADALVLFCSNFWEDTSEKKKDRVRVADIVFKAKNKFIQEAIPGLFGNHELYNEEKELLIREAKNMTSEAVAYASLAMRNRKDYTSEVRSGKIQPWIIQGAEDGVVDKNRMLNLLNNQTDRYFEISEVGHMAHIEASQRVMDVLKQIIG